MPNDPVPAADTGLPNATRRAAFLGALSLPALAAAPAVAAPHDPLLHAVRQYYAAVEFFEEHCPDNDPGANAMYDQVLAPPFRKLLEAAPVPTTIQGAIAGLEWAAEETRINADADAVTSAIEAVLSFLRARSV